MDAEPSTAGWTDVVLHVDGSFARPRAPLIPWFVANTLARESLAGFCALLRVVASWFEAVGTARAIGPQQFMSVPTVRMDVFSSS